MIDLTVHLVDDAASAFGERYGAVMQQAREDAGLPQNWGLLWIFLEHDPAPMTADWMAVYIPYNHPQQHVERLQKFVEQGLMVESESGSYRLSESGREKAKQVIAAIQACVDDLQSLPSDQLARLEALLRRAVDAAVNSHEPADRRNLIRNRQSDPGQSGSLNYRILQYLTDVSAFRDDCHRAAWQPGGISPSEWESLTYIWREEAITPAALVEKLPQRGYSQADRAAAFAKLVERGWIHGHGDHYHITDEGARIRQAAEDATERYFQNAWKPLGADEQHELAALLTGLTDALKAGLPVK